MQKSENRQQFWDDKNHEKHLQRCQMNGLTNEINGLMSMFDRKNLKKPSTSSRFCYKKFIKKSALEADKIL